MAWTNPQQQTTGTLINETIWNEQVADNIDYLSAAIEPDMLTNQSGGQVTAGAVVTADTANDSSFKTTTSADDVRVIGVVMETINNGATGRVATTGVVTVNVQGNVTRGNFLSTSTTAGRAKDAGTGKTNATFAIAMTGYAGGGAGTVTALILPAMAGGGTHAILSSTHTDASTFTPPTGGDLMYADASGLWNRKPIGTVGHFLKVTSASAFTWVALAASDLPAATESAQGAAELATQAETDAGTDDARIVTPLKLKSVPIDYLKNSKIWESDGGAAALSADAAGYLSAGVQPLVIAYNSATDTNVTGDGTVYTVIFDTEIVDRNSNYNNSTGVFTAPVTGKYLVTTSVLLAEVGAAHTLGHLEIVTSNRTWPGSYNSPAGIKDSNGFSQLQLTAIVDMDTSDTLSISAYVAGSTKTVDVYGTSVMYTTLEIYLVP